MSTSEQWRKNIVLAFIILVSGVLIVNLSKGVWDLLQVHNRVVAAEAELQALEAQKKALEEQYFAQTDPAYIDQQIREQLGLTKPDEVIVLVPEDRISSVSAGQVMGNKEGENKELPYWKQWLKLIFY